MAPMPSSLLRVYLVVFVGLFALLALSTAWLRWFRAAGARPPLSPSAAADAHFRKMRADLRRDSNMQQLTGDLRPKLWVFLDRRRNDWDWAGTQFRTNRALNRPYLRACLRSVRRQNEGDFRVLFVDDRAFQRLVPDWPHGDLTQLGETQRRIARQVGVLHLLYLYGGLHVPASFWCRRPLRPLFDAALAGGGGGGEVPPFCVRLPARTRARPVPPPAGDEARRASFLRGGCGEADGDNHTMPRLPARPLQAYPAAAADALGFFGCRPHCSQVRRLIEQLQFHARAVLESEELAFHGSLPGANGGGAGGATPGATLCAGRWTALRLEDEAAAAAPGSAFLAPPAGGGRGARSCPSTANPPSGVRRVGLHLQRTNGPWRELPGVPLVRAEVRCLDAGVVGRVDRRGDTITLAQLLGSTPVQFQEDAVGVWIPEDELLASRYYDWFPAMKLEAMRGFVLADLLTGSGEGGAGGDEETAAAAVDGEEGGEEAFGDDNPFCAAMDVSVVAAGGW